MKRLCFSVKHLSGSRYARYLISFLPIAALALSASAQRLDKKLINDGWCMQDASIVSAQGKSEGWDMENAAKCSIVGKILSKPAYSPSEWYDATVPGTVLTTLVNNGVYPEPTYGENNRPEIIPESLCHTDWWYRNEITVPASYGGKKIWLNFDGINYGADVWVNGHRAGPIKGAFIRKNFDITSYVKAGEKAVVAVCITPQPHTGTGVPFEHIMGTVGGPCGGPGRLDGPTFGCSNGWDFMSPVRDRNSGIWQDVSISATGDVIVKDPLVSTDLPLPSVEYADVSVETTVQNVSAHPKTGNIRCTIGDIAFEKTVEISPFRSLTYVFSSDEFPQLRISNPRLWWPAGMGEQNLYDLHVEFVADESVSDEYDATFGIREIGYSVPEHGNLALSVNGKRVFCKGGNWALDEFMKRIDPARLEAQVRMHRDANFNMIRLWGGMATSKVLYDLCDKYGIMVWDEFWQFNAADPLDHDLYMANVQDKVLTFRNHPSLVIWCARNEAYPPEYLDNDVRNLLAVLDPARHYQSNSGGGYGCNSGGPYEWQTPSDYNMFSEKKNFNRRETFKTEIGPQSIPTLESIQGMMPEKDWTSVTDAWAERNFVSGGGRKLLKTISSRYGAAVNVADFVRKSQMMNYEGFRAMYEGRMGRMFDPVQGILLWMSVPTQPSFVWQMMHYDLEPNASFFALKKACEPIHIQFNESEGGVIQVVNHNSVAVHGMKATYDIYGLDGKLIAGKEITVDAKPNTATKVCGVDWPEGLDDVHFVKLKLTGSDNSLVSDNFYWRGAMSDHDNLKSLDSLPVVKLQTKSAMRTKDGKVYMDVTLRNPGKNVALLAHLQLHRAKSGERVLPAYYSDNYISLLPSESRTVTVEASESDLNGEKPMILVDGWNVDVAPSKYIALNSNAQVDSWEKSEFTFVAPDLVAADTVRINCSGYNRGNFSKDPGFLEGPQGYCTEDIDLCHPLSGPEAMYQTVRWGACKYPNLIADKDRKYTVRLHFAELDKNTPIGDRRFDVWVNNERKVADLDVMKVTGGKRFTAYVHEVKGIAPDEMGQIVIELKNGSKGSPQICGYEIIPE